MAAKIEPLLTVSDLDLCPEDNNRYENKQRDLVVKRQLYAKYGVEEYWIVDNPDRSVLIYHRRGQNLEEIAILRIDDEITSPILPGFQLKVRTIFNI
ncbi:MAG TPA: Uma2 family endonuclease [Pyrinomonadaceae bacterium]